MVLINIVYVTNIYKMLSPSFSSSQILHYGISNDLAK
jgi:hypothetical protein